MDELEQVRETLKTTRQAFERAVEEIRPQLHRYCSRMLGSVADGEDAVQDTLAQAFFRLPTFHERAPLKAWLFRIAHNRCVDLLRRTRPQVALDEAAEPGGSPVDRVEREQAVSQALHVIVAGLPPRERACFILKDLLDHSLADIAAIVGSTETAVKAALHRARGKISAAREIAAANPPPTVDRLTQAYIERFNAQDWEGVRALMRADTGLEVVPVYAGQGASAFEDTYFRNYGQTPGWRLRPALVDGQLEVVSWRERDGDWTPWSVVRLRIEDGRIVLVRDYHHVPYLLADAEIEDVLGAPATSTPPREGPRFDHERIPMDDFSRNPNPHTRPERP